MGDGFVSYRFGWGEVIGFKAKAIPTSNRVRSSGEATTFFTSPTMPVYLHSGVSRTTFKVVWRDYNTYRGLADKSG